MMNYGPKLHAQICPREIPQIYHRFALFDVPEMGNFMTPRGNTLQLRCFVWWFQQVPPSDWLPRKQRPEWLLLH